MSTTYQPAPPPPEADERTAHPGRKRWLIPALVVLAGLVLMGISSGLGSKLSSVVENDQAAFLPESAESTKSVLLEERFAGAADIPAIIVWERTSGITSEDQAAVA